MIKIENSEVLGWEHAIRGMRNPMNSWEKSDSGYCGRDLLRDCRTCVHRNTSYPACYSGFDLGPNDYDLMMRLRNAGTDHRKYMRMIAVYVDITAPLYWWKEFDTYKVGTVANSTSTMHKLASTPITIDCFEIDDWDMQYSRNFVINDIIPFLENLRQKYLETKDKKYWKELIRWLPESWL